MDRQTYLRDQYLTLRQEISECQDRIFKITGIGLFVLPGGQYLARTFDASYVLPYMPLLVVAVALLYLAENNAMMRCGRYVLTHIDPEVPDLVTWEEWLESAEASDPRRKDRLVNYSFYIILGAYYVAAVSAAWSYLRVNMPAELGFAVLGAYVGLAVWFGAFLVANIKATTTTRLEARPLKRDRLQSSQAAQVTSVTQSERV